MSGDESDASRGGGGGGGRGEEEEEMRYQGDEEFRVSLPELSG